MEGGIVTDEDQERLDTLLGLNRENARMQSELAELRVRVAALEEDKAALLAELRGERGPV